MAGERKLPLTIAQKAVSSRALCTSLFAKGHGYDISNQTFAGLDTHAGDSIRLTGRMTGNSIAVSEIGEPKIGKKSK